MKILFSTVVWVGFVLFLCRFIHGANRKKMPNPPSLEKLRELEGSDWRLQ